jgi:hypothetical protein
MRIRMARSHSKILRIWFCSFSLALCVAQAQDKTQSHFSMATSDRVKAAGWWPTKGTLSSSEYAGAAACIQCHVEIAASQRKTPMFNAASLPSHSTVLHEHPQLRFWDEKYEYLVSQQPNTTSFIVKDKTNTVSAPIKWVFGADERGQTYILKHGDAYLESRLSYFPSLAGLGITPGHAAEAPHNIPQALGDPLDPETTHRCFGCHSTESTAAGKFDPENATLGVMCEACHGPGVAHVTAMQISQSQEASGAISNPRQLSPVDSVDFCGACHRTPVDVAVTMPAHLGVSTIRFQPYRLERSLCWGANGDSRITCIACHDPHKPVEHDLTAYDDKCLKCHSQMGTPASPKLASACTIATEECASCHMPKYEIPWVHRTFTDHLIQIVREGAPFRE